MQLLFRFGESQVCNHWRRFTSQDFNICSLRYTCTADSCMFLIFKSEFHIAQAANSEQGSEMNCTTGYEDQYRAL